ncbi:MAG: LamG-like jellyroll fold domain-containing protein [Bacteriovorax sp.]|jgi:hypothetical protein
MIVLSSCVNDSSKKAPAGSGGGSTTTANPLKAVSITPAAFNEDTSSIITLSYTDVTNRKALACSVNSLNKVSVSQACSCDGAGVCTVGVAGNTNASGSASFRYNVSIGGESSSMATASFTLNPIDDAPVSSAITPASFLYNTQSIITLSYSDPDSDLAASCSITAPTNVTVTQACTCTAGGVCTVGVTGTLNYIGSASFNYTVTANAVVSNSSAATLTIVGTPPVASAITPASFPTNTQSIITLSYTDAQGDLATTCSISNLRNVYVTSACTCNGSGVCTVGVTSSLNYVGTADFKYTVTAGGQVSNSVIANLTITAVTPVANNISPAAFNEDVNSIITLSYTDPLSRKATACSVSAATNVTVNQACACDAAGICTVGVRGTSNYNGAASFTYTVTAGGQVSNSATATLSISAIDDAPTVSNVLLTDFIYEDTQSGFLTLNYTDVDGDRAAIGDCTISSLVNLTVTTACACDVILGTCSLKITGTPLYFGAASFDYKVKTTTLDSNIATASLSIIHLDHAPVSTAITPAAFNEETQSIMTLSYTDADGDKAATCALTSLGNVTVTQACACDGAGVCTVGVTGTSNYYGAGSFYYTVTANGTASNSVTSTFTINNVDDAPVSTNITPAAFDKNTQSIITLAYTDADSDKGTSCGLTALTNVTVTQACACDGAGVCTVGVTGTSNYVGAASFNYTVTANSVASNSASATLTINPVNTAPTIAAISASYGNENTAYVLNFTIDDVDGPLACSTAVTATSTNTTLMPVANVVFGGTYPNCTATMTPANNIFGSTSLNFTVTDGGALFSSTNFIHTVRDGVTKTWLLGDIGDTNTYSYSSAGIETTAPGIIQLTPVVIDQTDDTNDATGFTALPTTLTWNTGNSSVAQNHATGAWTLASGVYSTTYSSRVMDAKKSSSWTAIAWKSTLAFGKELPLTNESAANYSLTNGAFANSLIGLWHFNEITGATTLYNSKTTVSDTYLLNSPAAATAGAGGRFSGAMLFNGDTVIKSAPSAAVTPGAFSVSTWIKKTTAVTESTICFWLTNDTTAATECPLRLSTVPRIRVGNTAYTGSTTINDGVWHNIVIVSDSGSLSTKVYVDGVLDGLTAPNFSTTGSFIYLGSNIGNAGSFTGTMDETAIWNRTLSAAEALELYRRGANRLKMYYRTCSDNTCSANPAWSAQISELDNISGGEAIAASPSFVIAPANDRYFQYQTIFETDVVPTTSAPDLKNVVVGPVHYSYSTSEEDFVTQEGLSFKSLSNFVATLGAQGCAGGGGGVHYQLSKDKINWSYYNGSVWGVGTNFATGSTSAQIVSGLSTYTSASNTVSDTAYIRTILKSDAIGSAPCEVDQLQLDGFE